MSITHTIGRAFTAAGVAEYPRTAKELFGHQGNLHEAGDATPTNIYTSSLRRWEFTWESPRPEIVARWRARFVARANFSFTDPNGQTYQAMLPNPDGFDYDVTYLPTAGTASGTTYTLTLRIYEANVA
jgi:hypothetical protein